MRTSFLRQMTMVFGYAHNFILPGYKYAMEKKWETVYNLLSSGSYPSDFDKSQRQNLRRYASNFQIKDGDLFFGNQRRVIKTKEEAMLLFQEFHSSPMGGHSGILKTRTAMCSRFYWHGMSIDIDNWVLECDKCQKIGKPLTAAQPLQCIKVSAVWELIGIDLTGPLPKTSDGFQYILTVTDYFSKWVEAFPLKTKSAAEVGRNLCSIIYRHGCPKRILSDQGREFVNDLNHRLCELLHIQRSVTAAYHPQTNGLDEKTNDNIKRALKKLVNDQQNDWNVYLDATLFSLRSKVHTTTKFSPFLLMYGREAVFPSEVPVEVPLSKIILPEGGYSEFLDSKQKTSEAVKKTAEDNIRKSQEKQKEAYARKVQKKYQNVEYNDGDEVLLLNMRKRGRKGGRIEPDFSGPYVIQSVRGKLVTLKNPEGAILKNKYNIGHLKPYRRSQAADSSSSIFSPCPQQSSSKKKSSEEYTDPNVQRCSVIRLASKQADVKKHVQTTTVTEKPATKSSSNTETTSVTEKPAMKSSSNTERSIQEEVMRLWSSKDNNQVEAVAGPYKLYDSSFRTLQGTEWVADEVIDAYLNHLIEQHKTPVYQLCAVVASSLAAGQFRCLRKMKFPVEDTWLCPVNTGGHWILVIVSMSRKILSIIDPMGNEGLYERKILRNWRNFLKMIGHQDHSAEWRTTVLKHNPQQDASSCGVLVLKFAEDFLSTGAIDNVQTTQAAISTARMGIACSLLERKGNAEDYCTVCSMLEGDGDKSMTEMVQCDVCSRWAHFECVQYSKEISANYHCRKCTVNK
ncbi:gypsy retrotransposon integrase-like protein 1 [Astyanax mexicanus]|nr:gypsy retrotransposon integrase-like protein 1 [Astyanax mexicanus]